MTSAKSKYPEVKELYKLEYGNFYFFLRVYPKIVEKQKVVAKTIFVDGIS